MTNDWTHGVVALDSDGRALRGADGLSTDCPSCGTPTVKSVVHAPLRACPEGCGPLPAAPDVDRSVSAESLRVLFPVGAVVSVVVISHRQTTMGQHRTVLAALAAQDGSARNVSGMVASVTGGGRTGGTHGEPSRVIVKGYGRADHAAHALIADLAVRLYGASTALTPVVI